MQRTFARLFSLAALCTFMYLLRGIEISSVPVGGVALALGFLLLSGYLGGQIAKGLGLSRITGYLVVGLLVGPGALALLGPGDLASLRPLDDLAIALIALTAGGELRIAELRGVGRYLASITIVGTVLLFLLVGGTVVALSGLLPFTAGRSTTLVLVVAVVFGSVAIASSPSVAIAVINDEGAEGPVSTTILGITVVKDVLVIVAFAAALSVAYAVLNPGAGESSFVGELAWEVGGSILVGGVLGVGIAAYLKWLGEQLVLFTIGVAWLAAEMAGALHLELLLLALTAGFTLENLLPVEGHDFVEALEAASLPVYALFFALAGTAVHLGELAHLWQWAALLVGVRAVGIWAGTNLGARLGGAPEVVRRYAWLGFISQAGVTLGMVTIVARSFPTWGEELRALFVAMVAVHELAGPVALKWGLDRAGESGRASG